MSDVEAGASDRAETRAAPAEAQVAMHGEGPYTTTASAEIPETEADTEGAELTPADYDSEAGATGDSPQMQQDLAADPPPPPAPPPQLK